MTPDCFQSQLHCGRSRVTLDLLSGLPSKYPAWSGKLRLSWAIQVRAPHQELCRRGMPHDCLKSNSLELVFITWSSIPSGVDSHTKTLSCYHTSTWPLSSSWILFLIVRNCLMLIFQLFVVCVSVAGRWPLIGMLIALKTGTCISAHKSNIWGAVHWTFVGVWGCELAKNTSPLWVKAGSANEVYLAVWDYS